MGTSSLIEKLEGGAGGTGTGTSTSGYSGSDKGNVKIVEKQCQNEIRELHKLFVTWFRGERPVTELEADLCKRLLPTFSHVAPNGHMVKGRSVLLQYLTDKYGCYQDRVFSIDVYNVQLLWSSGNKCLASYEEWQSWDSVDEDADDDEDDDDNTYDDDNNNNDNNKNNNKDDGDPTEGTNESKQSTGKQQFGRLSTCLLEKDKKDGRFRWIHVHETWLEAEEPIIADPIGDVDDEDDDDDDDDDNTDSVTANNDTMTVGGDDTVMTGPVPPSEMAKRLAKQQASATTLSSSTTAAPTAATAAATATAVATNLNNVPYTPNDTTNNNKLTPAGLYNQSSLLGGESTHSTLSEDIKSVAPILTTATTAAEPLAATTSTGTATTTTTTPAQSTTENDNNNNSNSNQTEQKMDRSIATTDTNTTPDVSTVVAVEDVPVPQSLSPIVVETKVTKPVTILVSLQSLSKQQIEQQNSCLNILQNDLGVTETLLEIVDGTNPGERTRRNELFDISTLKDGIYPQIFTTEISSTIEHSPVTMFWGTYTEFEFEHSKGTLLKSLGLLSSSTTTIPIAAAATTISPSLSIDNNTQLQQPDIVETDVTHGSPITRRTPFDDYEDSMLKFESSVRLDDTKDISTTANVAKPETEQAPSKTPAATVVKGTEQKNKRRPTLVSPMEDAPYDPEKEFLQKSHGILTFEDEGDEPVPISTTTATTSRNISNGTSSTISNGQPVSDASSSGNNNSGTTKLETLLSPPDASKKRHVSLKLEKHAKPLVWDNALVGVSIKGFDIGTSQGVAADSIWHADMTQQLEAVAQSLTVPLPKRRLNLPEMIYPTAHVAVEGFGLWLSWDATDALEQWAKCHQMIAVKSRIAWEGVNVMKSQDAKLWESKRGSIASDSPTVNSDDGIGDTKISTTSKAEPIFHYDWTYSTPFIVRAEGGEWIEIDESGMRTELLKDQTVPILFFDDIILFEDDLHDNGSVQYSIKLRVMPTCAYILARLYVRVDNVIVRLRETRVLIDFFGIQPQIFRDISWKECQWEQLAEHNLPTDVKSWTLPDTAPPPQVKEWQKLVEKLPEVRLPKNYYQFATYEF